MLSQLASFHNPQQLTLSTRIWDFSGMVTCLAQPIQSEQRREKGSIRVPGTVHPELAVTQ